MVPDACLVVRPSTERHTTGSSSSPDVDDADEEPDEMAGAGGLHT